MLEGFFNMHLGKDKSKGKDPGCFGAHLCSQPLGASKDNYVNDPRSI